MLKFTGTSSIKKFVGEHLRERTDLEGKVAVDIPAGKGPMSAILQEQGAVVKPFDLFPEFFDVPGLTCTHADMTDSIPLEDESVDFVLFQEGIEHLPDQLAALREINRILKPGGVLLITTPNISMLRARLSMLLTESEFYKRMPPNELDAAWNAADGRTYFGHLFLLGIHRLRTLSVVAGFEFRRLLTVRTSTTSLLLFPLVPIIAAVGWYAYRRNVKRDPEIPVEEKKKVYSEIRKLNSSPTILFGRHLFVEFQKVGGPNYENLYINRHPNG